MRYYNRMILPAVLEERAAIVEMSAPFATREAIADSVTFDAAIVDVLRRRILRRIRNDDCDVVELEKLVGIVSKLCELNGRKMKTVDDKEAGNEPLDPAQQRQRIRELFGVLDVRN
jgi:hypothetical protein